MLLAFSERRLVGTWDALNSAEADGTLPVGFLSGRFPTARFPVAVGLSAEILSNSVTVHR
jgi:hypothetical protein